MLKRKCVFTDALKTQYPGFRAGRYEWEAECLTCGGGTYIFVANKGALDLKAHIETPKHVKSVRGSTSSAKVTKFFVSPGSKTDESVAAAEGTLAFHAVKHHHSCKSMDCTCRLLKTIAPDSDIACKMSCARTKTEAIVNSVLAPHSVHMSVKAMNNVRYCSVTTDGSNHGSVKLFPILIQFLISKTVVCSQNSLMFIALQMKLQTRFRRA